MAKVTLTLKKEGPDINIPKDLNNSGLPPILKSFSSGCSFLPFFLPHWSLAFPLFLMNPILCGCFNFTCSNANSSYGINFRSALSSIMCLVSSGKKKNHFLLPRSRVIAWILWFSYLVGSANLSQGALTAEMEGNSLYTPCWNGDLQIMMRKSTLIAVLSLSSNFFSTLDCNLFLAG